MTEAADFDEQLPKEVVQERFDRLVELQGAISFARNRRDVGRIEEVIVEGTSKKDSTRLTGRTRRNKLVHFEDDGANEGSFRTVNVTSAHAHHLEGKLVAGRSSDPKARLSLPLATASTPGCGSCS
jgi:tRNA-2-methylthio-N6-dimethylallyladenosine synthase